MPTFARKALRVSALIVVVAGLIWHVLPHIVWAQQLEPELERHRHASRLEVPTQRQFEPSPADWSPITFAAVTLRVPLADPQDRSCGAKLGYCYRELSPGRVSIHSGPVTEGYADTLDMRAPHRGDLSLWRSASENWSTILALRERVNATFRPAEAWRYETGATRGVVSLVRLNGKHSHVLAVFPLSGGQGRIIGLAGLDQREVWQIVGSIDFVEP